uniref:RING-type domain-containing protein n=1 Tax=Rhabditophanes sp. KR3021 TaxID=114890 RepID=A0AC35UI92_9BILA
MCLICVTNPSEMCCYPCGHVVLCESCSTKYNESERLKPYVGRPDVSPRIIHNIDFGVSCEYLPDNESTIINEYCPSAWKGTVCYCRIVNYFYKKQCRRDDVESWHYMCLELFYGKLPWHSVHTKLKSSRKV